MSAFTAQAKMAELIQRLQLQMASATFSQSNDVSGFPQVVVTYVAPDASTDSALLKIMVDPAENYPASVPSGSGFDAGRTDGLGLPQRLYSPHIVELVQDSDQTSHAAVILKARLASSTGKMGIKILICVDTLANISAEALVMPTFDTYWTALIAAGGPALVLRSDEINPLTQSS
jgi:hypothetical protein